MRATWSHESESPSFIPNVKVNNIQNHIISYHNHSIIIYVNALAKPLQDVTVIKEGKGIKNKDGSLKQRRCEVHKSTECELPWEVTLFGAGFSCTSYSNLNKDCHKNATAMARKDKADESEDSCSLLVEFLFPSAAHLCWLPQDILSVSAVQPFACTA